MNLEQPSFGGIIAISQPRDDHKRVGKSDPKAEYCVVPHNEIIAVWWRELKRCRAMNNASSSAEDPDENRALGRFAAVQLVVQAIQSGQSMAQAIGAAAAQAWDGRFFSARTIEDWYYRYKRDKFQALQNRPRSDRGVAKAMDPAAVEALIKLRRENPQFSVKALGDELLRQGILEAGTISASTLQRRLADAGLDRQSLRAGSGLVGGPTKAFEVPLPNLLWMADCMHGPTIKTGEETKERTFLFALLDDCTRLVVHAQFYGAERLEGFLDALRKAVQTRGLPDKLYTDYVPGNIIGVLCPTPLCGGWSMSAWQAGSSLTSWAHNQRLYPMYGLLFSGWERKPYDRTILQKTRDLGPHPSLLALRTD